MKISFIPQRFKPTKKKLIWSIIIAIIVDILYWLVIVNTNLRDIIEPIVNWYVDNIASMLFSISGITIVLVIFIVIYIIWSLIQKKNEPTLIK